MKRKERLKSLFSELVDLLIPDEQINAVTPENTMPDPPRPDPKASQADLWDAVYSTPKDPVPLPITENEEFKVVAARVAAKVLGTFDKTKVPEKLAQLASGDVKNFCPVCGMPMKGVECFECKL